MELLASATGTCLDTRTSIMTTSSGDPAARRATPVDARFFAVGLPARVAITSEVPSHHDDAAIRCGFPDLSAVAIHRSRFFSSAASTSALRCAAFRPSPMPLHLRRQEYE